MKTNKSCLLLVAVLTFLFILPPTHTLAQETIVDRLDKKLDVKLPNDYETKVREFLDTCFWNMESKDNNTMRDIKTRMQNFTEQFVVEQMKNDWDIDRQNQLLFIWNTITEQIVGEKIYGGKDGDNQKLQDYRKAVSNVRNCREKYKNGIIPLVKERSAEAQRQIAANEQQIAANEQQIAANEQQIAANEQQIAANEQQIAANEQQIAANEQQITEAIKKGMAADTLGLKEAIKIYNLRVKNPATNDKDKNELENVKKTFRDIISSCKEYGIDYKAILRKEVGDEKKVKDILKFYEIE